MKDFVIKASRLSPFVRRTVLEDISFKIDKGEAVGILGRNGCGKSTLLRTISGIIKPDKGEVVVNTRLLPLLALGVGIELELTGMENIRIMMALTGQYSRATIKKYTESIRDFSGLSEEQLQMPAKMYSTGMLARLAFSTATATQPELLLVDEVLAVGDKGFQEKCYERIQELRSSGTTLVFVSHSPDELRSICSRGICLDDKRMIFDGPIDGAIGSYLNLFHYTPRHGHTGE
ncbi:MAG: ABC transporter ATP-binding protein [Eubacteriales bacterium]|nr:ABC transporter ATP-binding protein [Eubacteriales bacterium]